MTDADRIHSIAKEIERQRDLFALTVFNIVKATPAERPMLVEDARIMLLDNMPASAVDSVLSKQKDGKQ